MKPLLFVPTAADDSCASQNLQTDKYFIGEATFSFPAKKSSHAQWYFSNNPQALRRIFYNVPANIINFTWR